MFHEYPWRCCSVHIVVLMIFIFVTALQTANSEEHKSDAIEYGVIMTEDLLEPP